jgi:tetratricopeptide (TPR) repeat protein
MKRIPGLTLVLVVALLFSAGVTKAQTRNDVAKQFNVALSLDSVNREAALVKMLEVVDACTKIGAEADDVKKLATKAIPEMQYRIAVKLQNDKKYDSAILAYKQTVAYCDKFEDKERKDKANSLIPKLYFFKGMDQLKAEDLNGAITSFDQALEYDPLFAKVHYNKGLAYKKKNDIDNMKKSMDKAIETATSANDTTTAGKARDAMGNSLLSKANKSFTSKAYTQSIDYANQALSYNPNLSNAYLFQSLSFNALSKFDQAIDAANKGLALTAKPDAQADFYFQLGAAYEGKKDNTNACASYKKVTTGPNKAAAASKKTALKCK